MRDLGVLTPAQAKIIMMPSGHATVRQQRKLYPWQARVMDSLNPPISELPARSVVLTPNESGKTSEVITDVIFWHMDTFPGCPIVSTSGTNRQIKYQLYPNLDNRLKKWGLKEKGWKIKYSNECSMTAPNGSTLISFSTDDPGMAEGFHEICAHDYEMSDATRKKFGISPDMVIPTHAWKSLLIIVDEGKTLPEDIYKGLDRCAPTRLLITSSSDDVAPQGYFYDCFHKNKWKYKCFQVSHEECPHLQEPVKIRQRQDDIREWGLSHPYVQSKHFGKFPSRGKNMVYDMAKIDESMSGTIKPFGSERRGAVDLSNGGDEIIFAIREGNKAWIENVWHESDAVRLADMMVESFQKNQMQPEWINADNGGMGDPIIDVLSARGWPLIRLEMGNQPKKPEKYRNIRAEMHIELSHRINASEVILPDDPVLKDQFGWHKFKRNDKNVHTLEPKDKMPNSPDRADTVAMLFYGMPRLQSYIDQDNNKTKRFSETMHADGYEDDYAEISEDEGLFY